jgi:hypothetical protein
MRLTQHSLVKFELQQTANCVFSKFNVKSTDGKTPVTISNKLGHNCRRGLPNPYAFMMSESDILGSLLKSIACQKVNLPPLKNVISTPAIFINQWGPGVFRRLGLTNHLPFPNSGVTCES